MFEKKHIVIIFLLALIICIVYVFAIDHAPLETDAKEYDTLGYNLSIGKGYINSEGEPTAFRPPIYPFFLGAIYFITGHDLLWVRLIQAILGAAICLFVYFIATIIFDEKKARLSAYLCCLYPPLIINTSQILTETLFTFFLLLGILLIISKKSLIKLMLSGAVFGLALLTRPFLIFFFPFLYYWILSNNKYKTLKSMAVLTIGVLIILSPWTLRNYFELNSFVPFSNVAGLTLYNSYIIAEKGFGFNSLEGVGDDYYKINDETKQNKYLLRKTTEYIKENPFQVVRLSIIKGLLFIYPFDGYWYSISFGSKYNIFWGVTLCFSAVGIAISLKDNDINKKLIYFLFLSFLVGIMVFYGSPRFRLPIDPIFICFAANGIYYLIKKSISIVSMIVVANILLFITFRYFKLEEMFYYFKKLV